MQQAAIRIDAHCRSVFGVGIHIEDRRRGFDRCTCSLSSGAGPDPKPCQKFRRQIVQGDQGHRTRCPAGLTILSIPLRGRDQKEQILLTWGFLETERPPAAAAEQAAALGLEQSALESQITRFPRLSQKKVAALESFLLFAADMISLSADNVAEVASRLAEETQWRAEQAGSSFIAASPAMRSIRESLDTFANSREPLLIESEGGNGRHLLASVLHRLGPWRDRPFIVENIALLPEALQESEIFGLPNDQRTGLLEHAHGGTLFFVGIDRLLPQVQKRLHRAVNVAPAAKGSRRPAPPPLRIIAATDRSLDAAVRKGAFRSDLHRRLGSLHVFIPPLRERTEDIPLLVEHLMKRHFSSNGDRLPFADPEVIDAMKKYPWPGNVRELEEEVKRAVLSGGGKITMDSLSRHVVHAAKPPRPVLTNIRHAVGKLETDLISRTLSDTNWNKSQAARVLGLSRLGLQKKIDRYGLDRRS